MAEQARRRGDDQWGINWNQVLDTGGFVIGKRVRLELEVEAVKTT